MRDLAIDSEGNVSLSGGDLWCRTSDDEIAQSCQIRLRTFLGEAFLDEDRGVDYFEKILLKNAKEPIIRRELQRVAEGTTGVVSSEILTFDRTTTPGELNLEMQITTENNVTLTVTA